MSDEEFMMSDDGESFEYEESDEEMQDSGSHDAEQSWSEQYYAAKAIKDDDPDEAAARFADVYESADADNELQFRAVKQLVKLALAQRQYEEVTKWYEKMLASDVPDLYYNESLDKMIQRVVVENKDTTAAFSEAFLSTTVAQGSRLSNKVLVKVKVQQMTLCATQGREKAFFSTASEALALCDRLEDGYTKDQTLLQVYSTEIRVLLSEKYIVQRASVARIKEAYAKCTQLSKSVIMHPKVCAVLAECGGKIAMLQNEYVAAATRLMESFKQYEESGMVQEKFAVLKCLLLVAFLSPDSSVSYLESNEVKPYLTAEGCNNDTDIVHLKVLLSIFESNDLHEFTRYLEANLSDFFVNGFYNLFKDKLTSAMRSRFLSQLFKSFRRVSYDIVLETAGIKSADELENCVLDSIEAGYVQQHVAFDHVHRVLVVDAPLQPLIDQEYSAAKIVANYSFLQKSVPQVSAQFDQIVAKGTNLDGWFDILRSGVVSVNAKSLTDIEEVNLRKKREQLKEFDVNDELSQLVYKNMKEGSLEQQVALVDKQDKIRTMVQDFHDLSETLESKMEYHIPLVWRYARKV